MSAKILTHRDTLRYTAVNVVVVVFVTAIVNSVIGILAFGADRSANVGAGFATWVLVGTGIVGAMLGTTAAAYRSARAFRDLYLTREELYRLSRTDQLTGLYNRRGFDEAAKLLLANARAASNFTAIWMCDIDHFKIINDTCGHEFGDKVLVQISAALKSFAGQNEVFVARHGGEEFIAMKSIASNQQAKDYAEQIRRACMMSVPHGDAAVQVTVSVGYTLFAGQGFVQAVRAADKALYIAKNEGRNRVACVRLEPVPLAA